MPIVEIKKTIIFTEEEKELINKIMEMLREMNCRDIDIPCDKCPFSSICDYSNADTVEKQINKLMKN